MFWLRNMLKKFEFCYNFLSGELRVCYLGLCDHILFQSGES